MSPLQLSLSPDLLGLREAGYNISIRGSYLLVRDVPYVTSAKKIARGILVSTLELAGDRTTAPETHTMMFAGEMPCSTNGIALELNRHGNKTKLDEGLEIDHTFSIKPASGKYRDYFQKVEMYVSLISREVAPIDPTATALTRRVEEPQEEDYPFNYLDTASARAEINVIAKKLSPEKVAIIGVGGTGSYVLDLVAKTPVAEIHLFDEDKFSTHNAFRAPGAPSIEELREQPPKVLFFGERYSKMKRRILVHENDLKLSNVDLLRGMTFAFLCMDRGPDKKAIIEKLEELDIPFIDVGMGLYRRGDSLGGQLRVTTSLPGHREFARASIPLSEPAPDDEYDKDIQVADLNALNACLAVIRWKKLRGFYLDSEQEQLSTYTISFNQLTSESANETPQD